MKLMEEMRPQIIAQFPSPVMPTDPSVQQHAWAQWDTWGRKRQRVCSFLSPFPPKSRAVLEDVVSHSQHRYMLSTVHLPAGRRHKFQGSKLLSNTPVSSSCLLRCRNTIQLTVDIISFLCFSTFKLLSNTNAFSSHSHTLDVLNSF